jgi:Tfp pilus assembly protein PilE
MELLVIVLLLGAALVAYRSWSNAKQARELEEANTRLAAVTKVAEEDVTRFGEELQRLDSDLLLTELDEPARQDYQRALDSYEAAKASLAAVQQPDEIKHVTEALEDGKYAVACVQARVRDEPLPTRRPPCFFNPVHGPSTTDISWAPPGGQERQVPVCAADADRVQQGAEPDIRMVPQGAGRVPYWQGGPAYSPWTAGYFSGYAGSGLLPGLLIGSMLTGSIPPGEGFDNDPGGGDGGGDGGSGDGGGDFGGDSGGGDFGGGDFGGGFGDFGGF